MIRPPRVSSLGMSTGPAPARQAGGVRPGWFAERRPSSERHYHGRPAWERRIRWPPAHVTCTPSGSGPEHPGATWPRQDAADQPSSTGPGGSGSGCAPSTAATPPTSTSSLAAGLFVLCSGWVIEKPASRPNLWLVAALIFPLVFRRRAPMTVFLDHRDRRVRPVARDRPGPGRRRAPRRPLHRGARVGVGAGRGGVGHPRGGRGHGHGALDAHRQRRQVLRLPHRPRLHRAVGRRRGAGAAQPARLAGRAGRAPGARARPAGVAGRGGGAGPHRAGDARRRLAQHPGDGDAGRRRRRRRRRRTRRGRRRRCTRCRARGARR